MEDLMIEVRDFYNEIELQRKMKVANGKFGKISVWKHKPTEKLLFVKEIKTKHYNDIEQLVHNVMSKNRHFINLYYAFKSLKTNILIMDYIDGGDLFDLVKSEGRALGEKEVVHICKQVTEALHNLHENNIIHNDIKLENIMYNKITKNVHICDYGLCKFIGTKAITTDGTLDYFSPEKMNLENYDVDFDWWALGVMTYEMLTFNHPFKKHADEKLNANTLRYRQRTTHINCYSMSNSAKDFVNKLLSYNIVYRTICYTKICTHDFLNKTILY
jgi:serine/threonine protein kinase